MTVLQFLGAKVSPFKNYDGEIENELVISVGFEGNEGDFSYFNKDKEAYVKTAGKTLYLRVPVKDGRIKLFYENYKDYYYIPSEDEAIHKSLAEFVSKENKNRCNSKNCYTHIVLNDNLLSSEKEMIKYVKKMISALGLKLFKEE